MAKKVLDLDALGLHKGSLKSMISTLGNMIGDEVYMRQVIEIESSDAVIKALESVLEGVRKNGKPTNQPTNQQERVMDRLAGFFLPARRAVA